MSRGNNAPWAPLSWWIRALYKSIYYYYYYYLPFYHKHSHTRTHIVDCVWTYLYYGYQGTHHEIAIKIVWTWSSTNFANKTKYWCLCQVYHNYCLSSGCLSDSQKVAHVKPLLKKPNLDKEVFKNYRPVANLKYLGKTIERVVSIRISDHVRANNLSDSFQSAYKPFHGTETVLLRVNNDILSAMDDGKITALVVYCLYLSGSWYHFEV